MLYVYTADKKFDCSDLSEVKGVLKAFAGSNNTFYFEARNPNDEWVEYQGTAGDLLQQLDIEWEAYSVAHQAYWGY